VVEEGAQHPAGAGSMPFFLFTLQHVVEQRLSARQPGKLLPVDSARAWLADNSTWKQGITKIMPATGYVGDRSSTSWLLDKDVAYIYRGIATYGNPLQLARAGSHEPAYRRAETVTLECTGCGDRQWKSIAVYDGAEQIGALSGAQPRLTLRVPQKPGAHAAVLVGELPNGELRTSLPVMWSVWP
jgi:hypothetical protein